MDHELLDDTVEGGALIAKPFLARGKSTEILSSLGHCLAIEADYDSSYRLITVRDIKEDLYVAVS